MDYPPIDPTKPADLRRLERALDDLTPGWRQCECLQDIMRLLVAVVDEQRLRIEALEARLTAAPAAPAETYNEPATPSTYWR